MDADILLEVKDLLETRALNYGVTLNLFEVAAPPGDSADIIIRRALGDVAEMGGIEAIEPSAVWPLVEACLLWFEEGGGAGPNPQIMRSEALRAAMDRLKLRVGDMVEPATTIQSFWLTAGHPGYPIFWEFALLFRREASAAIFIGSSSD